MSTLVLIHGFTGSPSSWEFVRRKLELRLGVEVIAPAISGHWAGKDWTRPGGGFSDEVARWAEIIHGTPSPRVVCGYSLGARIALGLIAEHEVIASTILVGVHPGLASPSDRMARRAMDARWITALHQNNGLKGFISQWAALPMWQSQRDLSIEQRQHMQQIRESQNPKALAWSLETLGLAEMPHYRSALLRSTCPVELIVGAQDHKFASIASELVAQNPRLRLCEVPQVGHNLLYEAPELIATRCTAHLDDLENQRVGRYERQAFPS